MQVYTTYIELSQTTGQTIKQNNISFETRCMVWKIILEKICSEILEESDN